VVYALAVAAALLNAIASIMQRLGVETAPADAGMSARLITHMLQRRVWLGGFAVMIVAFIAQAVALHLGSLVVVQPILVSELVFVVAALGLWFSIRLRGADVAYSLLAAGGLATFLAIAAPQEGLKAPSDGAWIVATLVLGVPAAGLVLAGRVGPPTWRALSIGAGASIGFALTAALTKSVTDEIATGWSALLTGWQTYALMIVGVSSFLLMQSAFHAGPFTASQVTLILVNPVVSILIGVALFGDSLRQGALARVIEALAVLVMLGGAVGLATSPVLAGVRDESQASHMLEGRGRWARWRARRRAEAARAS
jgi:hypothetical protein